MDPTRFRQWCEQSVTNGEFRRAGGKIVCDGEMGRAKLDPDRDWFQVRGQVERSHSSDDIRLEPDTVKFMDGHRRAEGKLAPIEMI